MGNASSGSAGGPTHTTSTGVSYPLVQPTTVSTAATTDIKNVNEKTPIVARSGAEYERLKPIKLLGGVKVSAGVHRMETGIIRKSYKPNNVAHRERFERELKFLRHLATCPFVPKLLHVVDDGIRLQFYMNDCGNPVAHTMRDNHPHKIDMKKKMQILAKEYGVVRKSDESKNSCSTHVVASRNATVDADGYVYIIDFNGPRWIFRPPS